jgi:mono/diheme cytochrome c family protein
MSASGTMRRTVAAMFGAAIAAVVAGYLILDAAGPSQDAAPNTAQASVAGHALLDKSLLDKYCIGCHNSTLKTAGLVLENADLANVGARADVWEKVARKLRAGSMPPIGRPRPEAPAVSTFVGRLENALDRAAALSPNPGRPAIHRLNRTEYANAIRDVLALDIDGRSLLPADDSDKHGFDNIADVLSLSPALLERYMTAARKISRLAVGTGANEPVMASYAVPRTLVQDARMNDELPFGSRGGVAIHHYFPADGEYSIRVRLQRNLYDIVRGLGASHRLEVRLDGVRIKVFTVGGESHGETAPVAFGGTIDGSAEWEVYAREADAGFELRVPAKAGMRVVTATFGSDVWVPDEIVQPRQTGFGHDVNELFDGDPAVDAVTITGPYQMAGPGDTPSRRRIFVCHPSRPADEDGCATTILATLARRAYRRPISDEDVQALMRFYNARRGASFDARIELALQMVLAAPEFLFRIERDPQGPASTPVYQVSDLALASRLSFFLWSSIPDDPLLDLAARGKLREPAVLERQVRRMLADPKAKALVDNFAGQWLVLRNIRDVTPDPDLFPDFDENLRDAFQRETELFVESQIHDDRSVVDLLSANYTYVNERLARHYGIPNVYGDRFRRVSFREDQPRGGLLGQGSLLTVTSYPNRTSPVLRGKWLLENILGTPPPEPPPNVPALKEKGDNGQPQTVRGRLEQHRKNPVCAACHAPMDPLGFALENFDAIGTWRTADAGAAIDANGSLPSGAQFDGLAGLRKVLVTSYRQQFVKTVIEKLLTYALGRAVDYDDLPTVRSIARGASGADARWSAIILGIVKSTPFQMRRASS